MKGADFGERLLTLRRFGGQLRRNCRRSDSGGYLPQLAGLTRFYLSEMFDAVRAGDCMSFWKVIAGLCLVGWVSGQAVAQDFSQCDPAQVVPFDEADRRLWRGLPDGLSPNEVPELLTALINDPEASCETRAVAAIDRLHFWLTAETRTVDWDTIAEADLAILTNPYPMGMLTEQKRLALLSNAIYLGGMTGNKVRAVQSIGTDADKFRGLARFEKALASELYAETGHSELAFEMARRALDGGAENIRPLKLGRMPPEQVENINLVLNIVNHTLVRMGAWDEIYELFEPYSQKADVLGDDIGLKWAFAARNSDKGEASKALRATEQALQRFLPRERDGYVDPEASKVLYAMLMDACLKACDAEKLSAVQGSIREKFGSDFDFAAVLDAFGADLASMERHEYKEAELLTPVTPKWPWEDGYSSSNVSCETQFNIDKTGKPFNIRATCSKELFVKSAENAIKRARFKPKTIDGEPVVRYNAIQPLDYQLQ
jgi:hypothetical protein